MAKAPSFQFYASDFLTDTQSWEVEEVGIYIRLLSNQWVNGLLPSDDKRLARIAGCDYELFKKAWVIVGFKFLLNSEEMLYNEKLEEIRAAQDANREKQRLNGAKGGRPRKNETQTKPKQNPEVNPNHNPNHNPNESSSSSYSYILNNKEGKPFFSIAGEIIMGNPSDRIIAEHTMATDKLLMTIFSGMDKAKILERLDLEYVGYQFKDEMHLRNSFKSVAEKMKLEAKAKTSYQKPSSGTVPAPVASGFVIGQKRKGVNHEK